MNLQGAEPRVVLKRQSLSSRLNQFRGIKLTKFNTDRHTNFLYQGPSMTSRDTFNQGYKLNSQRMQTEPAQHCNYFCGYNFDELQKPVKEEILFESEQKDQTHKNTEFKLRNSIPLQPKTRGSLNPHSINTIQRSQRQLVCPQTPINKLSHIDEDITLHKVKPKGILLISSQQKQSNKGAYQSTEISRTESKRFIFDFPN